MLLSEGLLTTFGVPYASHLPLDASHLPLASPLPLFVIGRCFAFAPPPHPPSNYIPISLLVVALVGYYCLSVTSQVRKQR